MENSIGLKRVNIYTSLPGKVNPFSNIEIHCMTIPDFQFSFLAVVVSNSPAVEVGMS